MKLEISKLREVKPFILSNPGRGPGHLIVEVFRSYTHTHVRARAVALLQRQLPTQHTTSKTRISIPLAGLEPAI